MLNTSPSSGASATGMPTFCARITRNMSLEFPTRKLSPQSARNKTIPATDFSQPHQHQISSQPWTPPLRQPGVELRARRISPPKRPEPPAPPLPETHSEFHIALAEPAQPKAQRLPRPSPS